MNSELKRAIRNSSIIAVVVGIVVTFQGEDLITSLLTMLYTFIFVTPALWLSYHFTKKLINKSKED
jgi:ABC-type dipeptide/oligopeptide/nickel transport system permease component